MKITRKIGTPYWFAKVIGIGLLASAVTSSVVGMLGLCLVGYEIAHFIEEKKKKTVFSNEPFIRISTFPITW